MAPVSFSCPGCGCVLKSSAPVGPGKRIKCPKCATLFHPEEDLPDEEPAPSPSRHRPRGEDDEEVSPRQRRDEEVDDDPYEDEEVRPRPRKKKKRRKQAVNSRLVLWLVLGGVGLLGLIGGGLGLVMMFTGKSPEAQIVGRWNQAQAGTFPASTVEFRKDGTFTQSFVGSESTGKYALNGKTFTMTYEGGIGGGRTVGFDLVSLTASEMVLHHYPFEDKNGLRLVFTRIP